MTPSSVQIPTVRVIVQVRLPVACRTTLPYTTNNGCSRRLLQSDNRPDLCLQMLREKCQPPLKELLLAFRPAEIVELHAVSLADVVLFPCGRDSRHTALRLPGLNSWERTPKPLRVPRGFKRIRTLTLTTFLSVCSLLSLLRSSFLVAQKCRRSRRPGFW